MVAIMRVYIEHGDRTDRLKARLIYVFDAWDFKKFLAAVEVKLWPQARARAGRSHRPLKCRARRPIPRLSIPHSDAVKALFAAEHLGEAQRRTVLSGKSTDGIADPGSVVCACFGVGFNVIRAAIDGRATDIDQIGKALRAGTNCGSCLPELKRIVSDGLVAQTV